MTQTDRLLAALTRAGARGITRVDFQLPDVVDGGAPILNIPARILELKEAGFQITEDGRRQKCKVYVLVMSDRLFEVAAVRPAGCEPYVDRDTSHWKAA